MKVHSIAKQLALRLAVVAAVATVAGATSYQATHWEPRMGHPSGPSSVAVR